MFSGSNRFLKLLKETKLSVQKRSLAVETLTYERILFSEKSVVYLAPFAKLKSEHLNGITRRVEMT